MSRELDTQKIKSDIKEVLINIWPLYLYLFGGLVGIVWQELYGFPKLYKGMQWSWIDTFVISASLTLLALGVVLMIVVVPYIISDFVSKAKDRYTKVYR